MAQYDNHLRFMRLLGVRGVDPRENRNARRWGRAFEWPLLFLAFLDFDRLVPSNHRPPWGTQRYSA